VRCRALLVAALVGLLASACRLELDVQVDMAEDGSGSVEVVVGVDGDGIERIGGDLQAVLAIDDLDAAGWTVEGPEEGADGFTRVRFAKLFDTPDEAAVIFEEIAGEDGPFQDFAVSHEPSFARTEWGFTGRIDFSGGLAGFGDEALAAELDGEPLGQTLEEIEAQLGEPLERVIQVAVGVQLPGDVTSNATEPTAGGGVWKVAFGGGPVAMEATGEEERTASVVGAVGAATCAVLFLLYGLVRLVLGFVRRRDHRADDDVGVGAPTS
jgi:hypothetical protein